MSHKGTSGFIMERASAVVATPLSIWLLWSFATHLGSDGESLRAWLSQPMPAILLGLFIFASIVHMRLALGGVINDYIHSWLHDVLAALNSIAALVAVGATFWALYTLAFAG